MPEALLRDNGVFLQYRSASPLAEGEMLQLGSGRAAVAVADIQSGGTGLVKVEGLATVAKNTSVKFLDGQQVFWDHSANELTFWPVDDRDFAAGCVVGDWESSDSICDVELNKEPRYLIDLARDPFRTTIVGTQALGGLALNRRGGALNVVLSSTNEAQKVDALSVAGFSKDAKAIIEAIFTVPNKGAAGNVDASIGIANATHASDAEAITEFLLCHLNSNDLNIYFDSDDGTTEPGILDSTKDYVDGSATANRVHIMIDLRDPTDPQLYVNCVNVLGASNFDINAAVGPFKLLLHIEKTAATDVYEFDLHALRVRIMEQ